MPDMTFPGSVAELETLLSDPYPEDVEFAKRLDGDIIILGAGGKMGPTLARRIERSLRLAGSSSQALRRFDFQRWAGGRASGRRRHRTHPRGPPRR